MRTSGESVCYVDLTKGKCWREEVLPETISPYLGGSGFGWALVAEHLLPKADPFSPEIQTGGNQSHLDLTVVSFLASFLPSLVVAAHVLIDVCLRRLVRIVLRLEGQVAKERFAIAAVLLDISDHSVDVVIGGEPVGGHLFDFFESFVKRNVVIQR